MTTTNFGTEPSAHTIETERWPGVATVPSGLKVRVASPVARALFHKAVARLPLRVQMPNGEFSGGGSPDRPLMVIHRPDDFAARGGQWFDRIRRVLHGGRLGSIRPHCVSWKSSPPAWRRSFPTSCSGYEASTFRSSLAVNGIRRRTRARTSPGTTTSRTRCSNLFLDDTMTYSSALFEDLSVGATPSWDVLAAAQHRKIDRLLDGAGVGPGSRVLEIGTGWGELAIRAAQRGATVRSVTLGRTAGIGSERISAAGLADRVQVDLSTIGRYRGSTTPLCRSR